MGAAWGEGINIPVFVNIRPAMALNTFNTLDTFSAGQFSTTSLSGRSTQSTRGALVLRSSRTACSSSATSTVLCALATPMRSQKLRIASGV